LSPRILVQEVVQLPGLVADPQVVRLPLDQVAEEHEVGDQDLVHPADGLERVQVVLAGLGVDVCRLGGEKPRRGVHPLAPALEDLGDRVLGQPVHLDAGPLPAQLADDRDVAFGVAESDRRGHVQDPLRRGPSRPWRVRRDEVAQQAVDGDRFAGVRKVATALEDRLAGAGQPGHLGHLPLRAAPVVAAADDQHRPLDRRQQCLGLRPVGHALAGLHAFHQRLGCRLQGPADGVLALLGGVRFADHGVEEEPGEPGPVPQPVVPVVLRPALVRVEPRVEVVHRALRQRRREVRPGGRDRGDAEHPGGMARGGDQRVPGADAQPAEERPIRTGGVHDREQVRDRGVVAVRAGVDPAVRPAVAGRVVSDHPGVPGQVGDLGLPVLRVDDRPGRHQHDGRAPGAGRPEGLVADPDPVVLDVVRDVRQQCTHGLHPAPRPLQPGCNAVGQAPADQLNKGGARWQWTRTS
jgi:hypothetical protein